MLQTTNWVLLFTVALWLTHVFKIMYLSCYVPPLLIILQEVQRSEQPL